MRSACFLAVFFFSITSYAADPKVWIESSLRRVFPATPASGEHLELLAARNGKIAFQACVRNDSTEPLKVNCSVGGADDLKPLVRAVGFVPMEHLTPNTPSSELDGAGLLPGLVPDPLYPTTELTAGPQESRSFWITLSVPAGAAPGKRELTVQLNRSKLVVPLEISDFVIQPRRDFPVIHWWRGEATWNYYKTGGFEDERWWKLTRAQLADMLDHGSDVVYVPVLFDRRETFKRPCQLLIVNET